MCCWMGSHDWIVCNVVRYFSIEAVTRMGSHIFLVSRSSDSKYVSVYFRLT